MLAKLGQRLIRPRKKLLVSKISRRDFMMPKLP
jgi:hypothetical protein